MKCGKVVAILTSAVMIIGAAAIAYEYNKYIKGKINFTVNGQKVLCNSISDIKEYLEDNTKVYMGDIDITDCTSLIANTEYINTLSFVDYIKLENNDINIDVTVSSIDYNKLRQKLNDYNLTKDISINASIVNNGTMYDIRKEVTGKQINVSSIISDLSNEKETIESIDITDYIITPSIKSSDLQDIVDRANNIISWSMKYSSGQKFTCDIQYVKIENNELIIDSSFIKDIVKELEKVYDTAGKGFTFTDCEGTERVIMGGTYGDIMDSAKEREYLTQAFEELQSEVNRVPIMKQDMSDDIGNTYLEISITDQHMWHYIDSELCCETDIVTGDANKRRDTPTGLYFISERINGKYLTGADYRTWVNKWMRLTNSGVGLHDAGWRGSFGGTIYKGNGSHGCINLPKKYAYNLFDEVYTKMPVVVY